MTPVHSSRKIPPCPKNIWMDIWNDRPDTYTCSVWKLSRLTENLQDQQYNLLDLWDLYLLLVGYGAYQLHVVAFVGNILVGHWTGAKKGNQTGFREENFNQVNRCKLGDRKSKRKHMAYAKILLQNSDLSYKTIINKT